MKILTACRRRRRDLMIVIVLLAILSLQVLSAGVVSADDEATAQTPWYANGTITQNLNIYVDAQILFVFDGKTLRGSGGAYYPYGEEEFYNLEITFTTDSYSETGNAFVGKALIHETSKVLQNGKLVASDSRKECSWWAIIKGNYLEGKVTDIGEGDFNLPIVKTKFTIDEQQFLKMPNGKLIKVKVIQNPKRGWDKVFSGASHPPEQAKITFKNRVLNPVELDEPDTKYNCGGHVFGGKQMWIYPRQFSVILAAENNYMMVEKTKIKEDDVVFYYTSTGGPMHVGKIIKAVDGSLKVESKFSKWPLCQHEINAVVGAGKIEFFRRLK